MPSTTTTAATTTVTAATSRGRGVGRAGSLAVLVAALAVLGAAPPAHAAEETVSLNCEKIKFDYGDRAALLLPAVQKAGH